MLDTINKEFSEHIETLQKSYKTLPHVIKEVASVIVTQLQNNKKLFTIGNGGSAADAQHFASELTNRYKIDRVALPAIALTTDTSALTSIANDYSYDRIFSRQIEALASKGDIIFAISTSGNSQNILTALQKAREKSCIIIGLSGKDGGTMDQYCDYNIIVPSDDTPRIQEVHILVIHTLCQIIDEQFKEKK
jgi:D-sedoheptulose 7-phosphate isomerase